MDSLLWCSEQCSWQQLQRKQLLLLIHINENIHVEFWLKKVAYGVSIVEIDPTNIPESVIVIKMQQESIEQLFIHMK